MHTCPKGHEYDPTKLGKRRGCPTCAKSAIRRWQKQNGARYVRERYNKQRKEVVDAYGGKCVACGDSRYMALEIDHVDGVPDEHKDAKGRRVPVQRLMLLLIQGGFPPVVQVLCGSCHNIKTRGGDLKAVAPYNPLPQAPR